jgi:hypothetical protein
MEHPPTTKKYTLIQETEIRCCELRLERQVKDAAGQNRLEYVCGASGGPKHGHVLGVSGENLSAMAAICNTCPIPDALESHRSCLQLVPVRHFPAGQRVLPVIEPSQQSQTKTPSAEAFFPCRWFYTLYGQKQPRDCSPCVGCPYWFPRPPLELIPGYWPETQKMLRIVTGEERLESPPTGFRPSQETPPQTFREKLRRKIHL